MTRDILSEFGSEMTGSRSVDIRASGGGGQIPRDVRNYATPTGRAGSTNSPGLGGEAMPQATQEDSPDDVNSSGSPGLGGDNHGNCGSQS